MPEDAGLVFLGPTLRRGTVQAGLCVAAKFADDERLLVCNVPHSRIRVLRQLLVPADVFVHADHVEGLTQRIVNILIVPLGTDQQRRGDEPGGVECMYVGGECLEEGCPFRSEWCLVRDRPKHD